MSELFQHFQTQRIETHMFASQWFLTLYTAKFPLSIVYRILDLYLCEVGEKYIRLFSLLMWFVYTLYNDYDKIIIIIYT